MSNSNQIVVTLPGGRRADAQVGRHLLHTDQPRFKVHAEGSPPQPAAAQASMGNA